MSKFLLIAGIILAVLGLALGIKSLATPEEMFALVLTRVTAATLLTGGLLTMGLGSLIERVGNLALGRVTTATDADDMVSVEQPAVTVSASQTTKISEDNDLPPLRRFGAPAGKPSLAERILADRPAPPPAAPPVEVPAAHVEEVIEDVPVAPEPTRFRMPGFKRPEAPAPVVLAPAPVVVAPAPVVVAAAPPPPPPPPVNQSAADELLSRVPHTTRKIISARESQNHLIPAVVVRNTATGAAAAVVSSIVATPTSSAAKSVAETLDALEQAKSEIRTAFDRHTVAPPASEAQSVEELEELDDSEEPMGPEDDYEDDDTDNGATSGELFVVEEMTVRNHPARLLSDGTVEAETDEGWMRFENMEHLNEYLDAA